MPEEPAGGGEGDAGDGDEGDEVVGDGLEGGALEVDAAHGVNGETHGVDVGQILQDDWHIVDGCRDAGEQHHRDQEHENVDEDLLHAFGDGRDGQADAGC